MPITMFKPTGVPFRAGSYQSVAQPVVEEYILRAILADGGMWSVALPDGEVVSSGTEIAAGATATHRMRQLGWFSTREEARETVEGFGR